ncbi:MAG TPA: FKBP-type peptidyl-prolyl cis-trans isomerase [Gammaproteobacteria bacterium]|nr:FKBP-type peptidyl-prolyl cis-trans isomerase [Gammaproteobacteria bacterium]
MKLRFSVLLGAMVFGTCSAATLPATASTTTATSTTTQSTQTTLTTDNDKVSYAIGVDIGHNFKNRNLTLNPKALQQGVQDGLSGGKTQMTPDEMQATLTNFQKKLVDTQETQMEQMSAKNKADGDAYLADNKTKPGVVTLSDGLQYKVIKAGEGTSPTSNDLVTVNYTGTFINGKVFDSSYSRGKPVSFPVNQVIPGWTEALQLMKPGAVWELAIPSALAYGDKGAGPIGPSETLLFKVELIAVTPGSSANPTK